MKVWLIKLGEPLPSDSSDARLLRTGLLAEALAARGHEVTWWTSTQNHIARTNRYEQDESVMWAENYTIRMLYGPVYKQSVSLSRIKHHQVVARSFEQIAPSLPMPDVVFSALPTTEISAAAVRFAKQHDVPVILDVRDMWPDMITELLPKGTRWIGRLALRRMYRDMSYACRNADGICGVTKGYINWALGYAKRPWGRWDKEIPMTYKTDPPAEEALAEGREFWKRFGLVANNDELVICFFGVLGKQFDIATVINAARKLSSMNRKIRLVICGTGSNLERYKNAANGLSNILFPGWIESGRIRTLLECSSLGLAPYIDRPNFRLNIANKPIEYLSAGLPILYDLSIGPLADMIRENEVGVIYKYADANELVRVLCELDDDRDRLMRMSKNARALFDSKCTPEIVLQDAVNYLEELAEKPNVANSTAVLS